MRPLLDGDVILYEVGFSSEKSELNEEGEKVLIPSSWDFCQELVDAKIRLICDEVGATEPPLLFLTNTRRINKVKNKERVRLEEPTKDYVENFRVEAAKEKDYKGGRSSTKPFHFYNLLHYLLANYDVHVNEQGLEADDAMVIEQYSRVKQGMFDTVICSRDKDVRMCPGWHYSWECGRQASIGPIMVDDLGYLELKDKKKVFGVGQKFFYYQLLVGDSVDNIGGIKGRGPAFAYALLHDAPTVRECYERVSEVYIRHWGDEWKDKFKEQAALLWMIRELDENGKKTKWRPPNVVH